MSQKLEWYHPLLSLNLNRLLTFMAVAETGSFRASAELVNISQSALSVQIRQLEEYLGVPLFHRTTRQVALTDEGKRLYAVAAVIVRDLLEVTRDLKGEAALHRGVINIAVVPSLAETIMPGIVSDFAVLYPGINLQIRDADSHRCLAMIRSSDVDIGILSQNESIQDLRFEPLIDDDFFVVISDAYPAPHIGDTCRFEQLSNAALFLNPRGVDLRETLEKLLYQAGVVVKPIQEIVNTHAIVSFVRSGQGVTILPELALQTLDLRSCRTSRVTPRAGRRIGMVTLRARAEGPAVAAFKHTVRQFVKSFKRKGL